MVNAPTAALLGAALAAGFVNALAGGGTLLSFPALTASGLAPITANMTSTLALAPGYLGASVGQSRDLAGHGPRLRRLLPAAVLGGLIGAWLLLHSEPSLFRRLVPWLILSGAALLALQEPLGRRLRGRRPAAAAGETVEPPGWGTVAAVLVASVYGGYFGAGLSVILLAVLATGLADSLTRLNGLKQPLALASNLTAALLFASGGPVPWALVLPMAAAAWLGGLLGGRCASWVDPRLLRRLVVVAGIVLGLALLRP
jgi:uncharacterized membrane protein YfcA